MNVSIENIIAVSSIADSLDLPAIAKDAPGAEYEPEKFPALIMREKGPDRSILLFKSGKAVCTGIKDPAKLQSVHTNLAKQLGALGVKVRKDAQFTIQNIVASSEIGREINLNAVALSLGLDKVDYEPDQFPGLVFHLDDPQLVTILFGSGKIVCSGGKSVQAIQNGMSQVERELRASELMK